MGTNFLYSTWKRELLLRVAMDQPSISRAAQPPSGPQSARPQSARWRSEAAPAPPPRAAIRPMSARVTRDLPAQAVVTPRRDSAVKPPLQAAPPKPKQSYTFVAAASPCRSLVDADRHFREGRFGMCRDELRKFGVEGSLPRCCVVHKLLAARVALLSEQPKCALALYDEIPSSSIPDGEWNCAKTTVVDFMTATHSRQNELLNAIVDAFAMGAPSMAAYFVTQRAKCCIIVGHLDEALVHLTKATRLCSSCCDVITCKWLLTFSLDEECSLQNCALPPDATRCSDHSHFFCRGARSILALLMDLVRKSRTHSTSALATLADEFVAFCNSPSPPRIPQALIDALILRVQHSVSVQHSNVNVTPPMQTRQTSQFILRREARMRLQLLNDNPPQAFRFLRDNADKFLHLQIEELQRIVALRFMNHCCQLETKENDVFGFVTCSDKSKASLTRRKRHLSLALHPDKWNTNQESVDLAQFCFRWMADEFDRVSRTS